MKRHKRTIPRAAARRITIGTAARPPKNAAANRHENAPMRRSTFAHRAGPSCGYGTLDVAKVAVGYREISLVPD